jgi:peptidyl-prolyl cis-trans isomerase B (cyclophilin B)
MSKKYSNKGYAARNAVQPKKDNTNTIIAIVTVSLCLAVVAAIVIAILAGTGAFDPKPVEINMAEIQSEINASKAEDFAQTDKVTDYVKITVKDYGDIVIRLRPDVAPQSVKNFQKLVKEGHYSGKIFHRVIQEFMIQGGAFDGTGQQHSASSITGEFETNGFVNNLKHVRGVISMARLGHDNNSASNQFFICDATKPHLDGKYASFGYVLAGMEVVDTIAAVDTDGNDKPYDNVIIEKAVFVEPLK